MSHPRLRPASRRLFVVGALTVLIGVVAIVTLADWLRPPHPETRPAVPELPGPEADPRTPVVCDEPLPREGADHEQPHAVGPAVPVTSDDLYDCPRTYEGRVVVYRGEAIGDVLWRRDGAWVQLNDDSYTEELGPLPGHRDFRGANSGVGVFLPPELAEAIRRTGGPGARGDRMEVTGIFHRVDPRGEVAVIRAASGRIVEAGGPVGRPPLRDRQVVGILLACLAIGLTLVERARARRR